MRIEIKEGVDILGVTPQIAMVWPIIIEAWRRHFPLHTLVVTSVTDDDPGRVVGTKHKSGNAIDFRRSHITVVADAEAFVADLKTMIDDQFDVVLGGSNFHVEFDPQ